MLAVVRSPRLRYVDAILLCTLGALSGCGRLGFDPVSDEVINKRPIDGDDLGIMSDGGGDVGQDPSFPDADSQEGGVGSAGEAGAPNTSSDAAPGGDGDAGFEVSNCALAPGALACSDFENGLPSNMFVETNEGSVSTQDGLIEASTHAASGWARARAMFPAVTSGSIYLRMSMFIRSASILDLVNFAELVESNAPGTGVDFNFRYDELEVYAHQGQDSYVCSGCLAPRDRWFCFRARVDLGDGDGRVRTWIEDALLHDIQGIDTLSAGGMEEAAVGLNWVDPIQSQAHVMLDDFAVSTSPLTSCP